MKHYVLQDLNDPNKLKVEQRSSSSGTICEISELLVGKAWKIVDGEAVLDEVAESQRLAKVAQDQATALAVEYKSKRAAEYPAIGDQLDAIYKKEHLDDPSEYEAIADQIEAVKLKYPKPE